MSDKEEEFQATSDAGGGRFAILQPNRDLQSNWELDVAKNLEDYLLKICSGEISSDRDDPSHHSVNFAEAALLLQGSVQVYSRKVEYLYSLVLHALEFVSQKRQDQPEKPEIRPPGSESNAVVDDENDIFLGLDDVPVEAKNCLDSRLDKDDNSNHFLKPPANLLVLEGDCLDTSGDAGELESYLLSTCDFYRDFLLLDPCDAGVVCNFLKANSVGKEQSAHQKGSSVKSKNHHSNFTSPAGRSGGIAHRSSLGRHQSVNPNESSEVKHACDINNNNIWSEPHFSDNYPEDNMCHAEDQNADDSDDDIDNPWKPLNPHEPGTLKIKPFRKGKTFGRRVSCNYKQNTLTSQFPVAKLDGIISPDLAESVEVQLRLQEKQNASQSPSFFEKLRESFMNGERAFDVFGGLKDENDDEGGENDPFDLGTAEFDLPNDTYDMDTDLPSHQGKNSEDATNFDGVEAFSQDNPDSQASLEDLCRSHLDALLASIAETEKQTDLAARVSTWKQRIEQTLDEQDTQPPFDIHQYGEKILDTLEAGSEGNISFADVVMGQPKHDIARTFSALLQLVNNGDVDLERPSAGGELVCYTATNPFYVRLLRSERRREEKEFFSRKKRMKPHSRRQDSSRANPNTSESTSPSNSLHQNGKLSVKLGKGSVIRCTPEGKRRRRSRLTGAVDLQSAG